MKPIKNIQELKRVLFVVEELKRISRALHTQDENACNYGLTQGQKTRVENLNNRACELAGELGLKAYHQGDPRGCSLYLIEPTTEDKAQIDYTDGIAVTY